MILEVGLFFRYEQANQLLNMREKEPIIKKMPDRETLEAFLEGVLGSKPKVVFNIETKEFQWLGERPKLEPLGEPKTEDEAKQLPT